MLRWSGTKFIILIVSLNSLKKIAELSGGERSRLLFVGLSLAKYHFLLLDEPTNHLDIEGKEELAHCLTHFEGGLLLVSHDRELIESSCNRFWYINDGQLVEMTYLDAVYEAMSVGNQVVSLEVSEATPSSVLLSKSESSENYHSETAQNDEELSLERLLELEELLTQIEHMPEDYVERAEKAKERERRDRVRGERLLAQEEAQARKMEIAMRRSRQPPKRKTGKPVMMRSKPLFQRKKVEKKDETDENAADEQYFA